MEEATSEHFRLISGLLIARDMASWNLSKSVPRAVHASLWRGLDDDSTADDDDGASEVLSTLLASDDASSSRG